MSATTVHRPDHGAQRKHFLFTEEHDELRASIRRFVQKELFPHREEWERTTFPDSVFHRMGELGLLGLAMPEEYGGQGGDYISSIVLAEEMRRCWNSGLALNVSVHVDMAIPPIAIFGTEEQKREWLVPAIRGEKLLCLGITEPDAGSDVAGIRTTAVYDAAADEYVINGSKTYITNGIRADGIVLVTKTDPDKGHDGMSLFLVPMDAPGVIREKALEKLGLHGGDTALLAFQDVRVPASALLGEKGQGFRHISRELQGERLTGAAAIVAEAQEVFDRTLQYALERKAFGREIGHFQVIRHKFGAMATKLESARQMVYVTAWRFANGEYPVREIAMCKLHAAQVVFDLMDECLQIHGGAGYMKEYEIERMWRDARIARIGGGTDEIMTDVIGRSYGL